MRYALTALIASKNAPESYLESFFEWHKQKDKLQKLMTAVTDYFLRPTFVSQTKRFKIYFYI